MAKITRITAIAENVISYAVELDEYEPNEDETWKESYERQLNRRKEKGTNLVSEKNSKHVLASFSTAIMSPDLVSESDSHSIATHDEIPSPS